MVKISDEEAQATIEAWFDGDIPTEIDFSDDMRKALKVALKVRKRLKRETGRLGPDEVPAAQAEYDRIAAGLK
jgi:hypothetical protein